MHRWLSKELVFACVVVLGLPCLAACAPISPDDVAESPDGSVDDLEAKAASTTQYEAEDRSATQGCAESATRRGYTGRGYMQFGGNGAWIEWNQISAQAAGEYSFTFRYANGSTTNRRAAVFLNGANLGNVAFAPTGGWNKWGTATLKATLRQGANVVRVTANTQKGGPHLDNVVVEAVDTCPNDPQKTEPGACGCGVPEGSCAGTSTCVSANEWESVTLSCTSGSTINRITFASYGTPNGSCTAAFSNGTCHAASSLQQVEAACVGRQSCTVEARNDVFDDPCGGVAKRLAVTYACGTTTPPPPSEGMPIFLMAGQSNMVGNVDGPLFDSLLSELGSGTSSTLQSRLKSRLSDWYLNSDGGYPSYGYSDAMATFESSELIRLKNAGLVGTFLKTPLSSVMCAMNSNQVSGLTTNCGSIFGPELMLGHYLNANGYAPTSLIKVAQGGSNLYTDWRSPKTVAQNGGSVGPFYTQLQSRIDSLKSSPASVHASCATKACRWGGFIWFQGENDSMDQASANAYAKNLANLLADVRGRVGSSTLPVVIVEIGKWAQSLDYGATVRSAQRSVVAADANARIVNTDDLSGYYHYDPAAQLIIGERVGIALSSMLGGVVDNCPSDPLKTEPGMCGCGVPEGSCGGTLTCPAAGSLPTVTGCDGVLLIDPSAVEARSSGITNTSGPAGAPAVRIGDDQSIDIKDTGCMQLGKSGADFSVSMWLKASAGLSQIFGTTSQYSRRPGFLLYTESTSDGNIELRMASFGSGFDAEFRSVPFKPGTWVHAVLRYDGNGANSSATLDLNLNRKSGPAAADVYNDRLRVGDEGWGPIAPFEVSELRSYARLLSDGEVRALFLDKASATGVSGTTLRDALTQLEGHVNGTATLSSSALATAAQRFSSATVFLGADTALMDQAFRLVASYETKVGPLFMTNATKGGIPRDDANDGLQLARVMLKVQQAIVDWVYVSDSVQGCTSQLQGKRFRTADYFPGVAPAPPDPNKSYSVTVDATLRADWGHPVAFSKDPVRRPTGLYLSPGSIAEVSVPQSMVNAGFSILVGAHTIDMTEKWIFKRMDRVSTSFPITKSVMRVANPLGGGIYIVVPYLANLGKVNLAVKNVIEAPFFSYKSWHKTTAAEWQARRTAPAPWADFESDKYLMQVPRSWIYASGDQTTLMRDWDAAMDGVSDLMGFPPDKRNRTVLYQQIDVILQPYAFGIGYPQVNNTYDANEKETGNKDHWFLRDPSASDTDYHELGHAQVFSKFRGEEEAAVNMLYPYVRSVKFGVPFDQAFALSMGIGDGFAGTTPDDAAMHWMVTENFRAGREMDYSNTEKDEMRYQQRGYAKYADIYRIFGWQPLRSFWYQENLDYNNGTPSDGLDPVDSRILRLSKAAGADLTPLIHFWGIFPVNPTLLKQKLTQAGIGPSEAVRAHIARYRSIAPGNNADFNALYERMFPGRPSGESPDHGPGWFDLWRSRFNGTHGAQIRTQVDAILNRYY